jgi:hypothetical protein
LGISSAKRVAIAGHASEGFITIALPAAMAPA